jgi:hypothetical protein
MYQFIHVPKTGGIALQSFLIKHYRYDLILNCSVEHETCCTTYLNSIITIREPLDRFISMYRFWKNGSEKMKQSNQGTIKEYINYIKTNDNLLINHFTKEVHYYQQYRWIPENSWSCAIVLKYKKNMKDSCKELLNFLGIVQKFELEFKNVSNGPSEVLDDNDLLWIKEYYSRDFELWEIINNKPELFKKVI